MIVVDASVLIDVLLGEGSALDRIAAEELAAPHLLDAEVGNVIRRFTIARELEDQKAERALEDHLELEIIRYAHTHLLQRAWELRANLTVYDALYVSLAEALDAPLVTLDRRLAGVPGTRGVVEVIAPTSG